MKQRLRLLLLRLLGMLLRVFSPDAARIAGPRPRVLLLRPDQLGDVLLSRPAIDALHTALPEARLTVAVGPWGLPALGAPCATVLSLPFPGFTHAGSGPVSPYWLLLRQALRLRRERYEMAVVLRPDHWWGALLVALAGIPVRVGYRTPATAPFLTIQLPLVQGRHAVEQAFALAAAAAGAAGGTLAGQPPPLPRCATASDRQVMLDVLRAAGISTGDTVLVVHPGSNAPLKSWPLVRFAEAGAELATALGVRVVITGTDGERRLAARLAALLPGAINLAGCLSWGQLEALLGRATLVLGIDSGPLHLAAAVGTPSVALFGPADPMHFAPWGPSGRHRVCTADLACRPCRRLDYCVLEPDNADSPPCMRALEVGPVVAAALAALSGKGDVGCDD